MATLEEEFDAREPKSVPSPYPDVPPFPTWLLNPIIIGLDKTGNIEPWDVLAVGILNEFEMESCSDCGDCGSTCEPKKLVPNQSNGVPYLAKSSGGKGPWIKIRVAWRKEIERYNELFLNDMNIVQEYAPQAYDDRLPPMPPYFIDAIVIRQEETCDGMPLGYALALNKNDNEWWVIKTVGGRMWVSDHYATKMDFDMADEVLMKGYGIKPELKVEVKGLPKP